MIKLSDLVPSFFVAYTQRDEVYAKSICNALKILDLDHYSMNDNPIGVDFDKEGHRQMELRSCVIVLISVYVHESRWVQAEINRAREKGKTIFPVICSRGEKELLIWPDNIDKHCTSTTLYDPQQPDLISLLLKGFVETKIFDRGIVPVAALSYKPSVPTKNPFSEKEQFAAELIEIPVVVKRTSGDVYINVNLTPKVSCRYAVISNTGKKELQKHFVHSRLSEIEKIDHALEPLIYGRLKAASQESVVKLPCDLPMRWASGGVLPVITFRQKKWVALLFRDIAPYGWNIPLGSSERYSGASDDIAHAIDLWRDELRRPVKLATREFLEEILVLDGTPDIGASLQIRPFNFVNELLPNLHNHYREFCQNHRNMRNKSDILNISPNKGLDIHISERQNTKCYVHMMTDHDEHTLNGFLVAVNPSELGIEVVLPLLFSLNDNDYLLDGEITSQDKETDLVRMPIALFSVEYLRKIFAGSEPFSYATVPLTGDDPLCPRDARPPSIILSESPSSGDIHLFDWDIKRRIAIANEDVSDSQPKVGVELHKRWVEMFGDFFQDAPGSLPMWFTPTTAKVIRAAVNNGLLNDD